MNSKCPIYKNKNISLKKKFENRLKNENNNSLCCTLNNDHHNISKPNTTKMNSIHNSEYNFTLQDKFQPKIKIQNKINNFYSNLKNKKIQIIISPHQHNSFVKYDNLNSLTIDESHRQQTTIINKSTISNNKIKAIKSNSLKIINLEMKQ